MKYILTFILGLGLTIAFAQECGGAIAGVVTDSVTGKPIAGACVHAMSRNQCGGRAVTNQNGEYIIENLRPGYYEVKASAMNYLPKPYSEPVPVQCGQTTPNINFALVPCSPPPPPPQGGGISGVVTDSITGKPIAGAEVHACGPTCGKAITNPNGEYLIQNLAPGEYRVGACARGYRGKPYPELVFVKANLITPNINFALAPSCPPPPPPTRGSISGKVIDKTTNKPIVGAMVTAMGMRRRGGFGRALTGPDGTYKIENLLPGGYRVVAGARGYKPEPYPELVIVREAQNTPDIDFALIPRGEEELKVKNIEENHNREEIRVKEVK